MFPSPSLKMEKLSVEKFGLFKALVRDFCQACLKDAIREPPRRDTSRFRSEVSALVSQVKQEKRALNGAATKMINYGTI